MRNKLGIYHLFGDNKKAKEAFYFWCKNNDEFCEYDLEHLEISLVTPAINNIQEFVHFHKGNILDWLEEQGYYISIPVRGEFKYITVVFSRDNGNTAHQRPIFSNSGVKSRDRAIIKGIQKAIEHLEEKL